MRARENPVLKAGAFLLAVVTFSIAAVMGCYQMVNLNVIWGQTSAAGGYTIRYLENQDLQQISYLLDLIYTEQELGSLSSYEQQMKSDLEQQYQWNNTNLRWQLLDPEGGVLQGNTTQARPSQPEGIYWGEYYVSNLEMDVRSDVGTKWADVVDTIRNPPASPQRVESDTWAYELSAAVQQYREDPSSVDLTAVYLDGEGKGDMLRITTQFGVFAYAPSVQNVIRSNVFGYHYDLDAEGWTTNAEEGWTEGAVALDLVLWVNTSLAVEGDSYAKAYLGLDWWKNHNVAMLVLNLVCVAVGIAMLVFLCVGAGCRKGTEGVYVNWFHRLPGELILVALFLLASYPVSWLVEDAIMDITYTIMPMKLQLLLVGGGMAAMTAMTAGLLTTVSARLKSHTLVRSTLLWWAWGWIKKILGMARRTIPLVWRVGMGGCLYMLVSLVLLMSNAVFRTDSLQPVSSTSAGSDNCMFRPAVTAFITSAQCCSDTVFIFKQQVEGHDLNTAFCLDRIYAVAVAFGTPVHLRHQDGIGLHHRHGFAELLDETFRGGRFVATVVPAHVGMHGIADVIARDGMQRIILVIGLVTRPRHPDNARVAVGADHINNGLEEVMQRLGRVLAVLVKNGHRLVSQFYEELPTVFFHFGIRTDGIPHIHQVFLIFPAHLNGAGTHAGRTHHHIKPMFHSRFGQRDKERAQISVQSHPAEAADVGFSCFRPLDGQVGVVCPTRVEMQAEDVAPRSLGRVGQCRKELVKILTAFQDVA